MTQATLTQEDEQDLTSSTADVSLEVVDPSRDKQQLSLRRIIFNERTYSIVSLVLFIGGWHWAAASNVLGHSSALATPLQVIERVIEMSGSTLAGLSVWGHMWESLRRVLIGFTIASTLAVPLGLLMALNPYVNAVVKPIFDLFKPMPPLAWISIAILWFGIQEAPKIFIIVIGTFVPALLNAYNGVQLIDPELYDVVRTMGGKRWNEIRMVCVPASLPAVYAGLQIALSSAWTCVLAAELVSSRSGLGYIIIQGMKMSDPSMVMAGMFIIAILSLMVSTCMDLIFHWLFPWQRDINKA